MKHRRATLRVRPMHPPCPRRGRTGGTDFPAGNPAPRTPKLSACAPGLSVAVQTADRRAALTHDYFRILSLGVMSTGNEKIHELEQPAEATGRSHGGLRGVARGFAHPGHPPKPNHTQNPKRSTHLQAFNPSRLRAKAQNHSAN